MIVQPGKDCQVTVEDDLAIWKKILEEAGKNDVMFNVCGELNQLSMEDPETYAKECYVDENVVVDIGGWLKELSA